MIYGMHAALLPLIIAAMAIFAICWFTEDRP